MSDVARQTPDAPPTSEIAAVALELFAERGFEETTVEDIAAAVGVGRRTLFRYFPSKNDMVWGDFDRVLRAAAHPTSTRATPRSR